MRHQSIAFSLLLLLAAGCSGGSATPSSGSDLAVVPDLGAIASGMRGRRYCEVLVVTLNGPNVHVAVYNTEGLNECPKDAWAALDVNQIKAQQNALMVILNGPRYWTLDAFVVGALIDPTPVMFGALAMRQAGALDLPLADAMKLGGPYLPRRIQRHTAFRFDAGKPVYELVDPSGKVYDMQSYSVQAVAQTEADLLDLGSKLSLPANWSYRSRVLGADLQVTAVNDIAFVVQDDFADTYQQSQQ